MSEDGIDELFRCEFNRLVHARTELLDAEQSRHDQVRKNIQYSWGDALDLVATGVFYFRDQGKQFSERMAGGATKKDLAVQLLYHQACKISQEMNCLLRNGFPDGALARWRSLFEVTLTAGTIAELGEEAARRFVEQQYITSESILKNSCEEIADDWIRAEVSKEADRIRCIYKKKKISMFEWADTRDFRERSHVAGIIGPQHLAAFLNLDHMNTAYKAACNPVHATFLGVATTLAETKNGVPDSGPTFQGLADPTNYLLYTLLIFWDKVFGCLFMRESILGYVVLAQLNQLVKTTLENSIKKLDQR